MLEQTGEIATMFLKTPYVAISRPEDTKPSNRKPNARMPRSLNRKYDLEEVRHSDEDERRMKSELQVRP